jgi:hypothetical protein
MDKLLFVKDKNKEGKRRFDFIINEYRLIDLLLKFFEFVVLKEITLYTPFDEDIKVSKRLQYLNDFMLINDNMSEIKKKFGQTPFYFMDANNKLGALFLGNIIEKENGIVQWDNFTQGGRNKKAFKDKINYDNDLVFQFNKEEYLNEINKWKNEFKSEI